ncbi:hypothetical protein ACYTX9_09670, partial [Streptococcus pyogenes]
PALHILEHAVFIGLGVLTTFAAYQYAQVVAWLLGGSLAAMAWVAAFFFGVTAPPDPAVEAILNAKPAVVAGAGDEGRQVF